MHPGRSRQVRGAWAVVVLCVAAVAPAWSAEPGGAPLRVLVPFADDGGETSAILSVYLAERLGECRGVEVVQGARAARLAGWLSSGAWELTDEQRWKRLRESVSIDAIIEVRAAGPVKPTRGKRVRATPVEGGPAADVEATDVGEGEQGQEGPVVGGGEATEELDAARNKEKGAEPVRVMICHGESVKVWDGSALAPQSKNADLHAGIAAIAAAAGRELGLNEAQRKPLADPRINDAEVFRSFYRVAAGLPVGVYDPLGFLAQQAMSHPHWALDVASLRISTHMLIGPRKPGATIPRTAVGAARRTLVRVLATAWEREAWPLVDVPRDATHQPMLDEFESVLVDIAAPLLSTKALPAAKAKAQEKSKGPDEDAIREIDELAGLGDAGGSGKPGKVPNTADVVRIPDAVSTKTGKADFTPEERCGAVRLLGRMGSMKALPLIERIAARDSLPMREAAASALGGYTGDAGKATLTTLAGDAEPTVAAIAGASMLRRNIAPPATLKARAVEAIAKPGRHRLDAVKLLASAADKSDLPLLEQLLGDDDLLIRATALRARLALVPPDTTSLARKLLDPDTETVLAAVRRIPQPVPADMRAALVSLTNDPFTSIAWAARDALESSRPTDPRQRVRFDLETGHHYTRQQCVAKLAASTEPWAVDELATACANAEPHTRIAALMALAGRDAARARPLLLDALRDTHKLVRLNAAAVLANPQGGVSLDTASAAPLRAALALAKDPALRLYLDDAIARAEGKPLPPPQPSVNPIPKDRNLAWLTGGGETPAGVASPYNAYYQMGLRVNDYWKKSHAAGKVFFARVTPLGDPGHLTSNPIAQDDFWLALDAEVTPEYAPFVDGLVYGEETMSMSPGALWDGGWRLFCADTGIDPKRVAGDQTKLTPYEKQAFIVWADRRVVEGFNRLYDYTKLKFGKLRPGIAVCTFLGEQMLLGQGPNEHELAWKFDVGGIYHYFGNTRKTAYTLVRRYKTLWPDRPVLWLSNGIGIYERNPVRYTTETPQQPLLSAQRAYFDSLTAYAAGADTGWFSIWIFVAHDFVYKGMSSLRGVTIGPEEINGDPARLKHCIDYSFARVDTMMQTKAEIAANQGKDIALRSKEDDLTIEELDKTLDDKASKPDPIAQKLGDGRARMTTGFRFYGKYLYDLARLFSSLPRVNPVSDTLAIQPGLSVWEGTFASPCADLLTSYDYSADINQAARLNLSKYKLITANCPTDPVTDATISSITSWLKNTPGVLYVYGSLNADNTAQQGTPEDFTGTLKYDWPWEKDLVTKATGETPKPAPKGTPGPTLAVTGESGELTLPEAHLAWTYELKSASAKLLLRAGDRPALVLWRHPDFKGVVVFDGVSGGVKPYRDALKGFLNQLAAQNIGRKLDGPIRHEILTANGLTVATTSGSPDTLPLPGVDLLLARPGTLAGAGAGSALVSEGFHSTHAAATKTMSFLTDLPITKFEPAADSATITCPGLIQVGTTSGAAAKVTPVAGGTLPEIPQDKISDWILNGKTDGVATITTGKDQRSWTVTYLRSKGPVKVEGK